MNFFNKIPFLRSLRQKREVNSLLLKDKNSRIKLYRAIEQKEDEVEFVLSDNEKVVYKLKHRPF